LQVWYAVVLIAVIASFGGILFGRVRDLRLREIDAQLVSAAQYLDASLRAFPPHELDTSIVLPPLRPQRVSPEHSRERLLANLAIPENPRERRGRADRDDRQPYFAIWRSDGSVLKTSLEFPEFIEPDATETLPGQPNVAQRGEFREAKLRGPFGSRVLVGQSVVRELSELTRFAWQIVGVSVAMLAVGLAGGWMISARIVKPIAVISNTAAAISETRLSERIDTAHVDSELAELAGVLNATFDRLQFAFERQTQFTADASHELRTPLAVLRAQSELALSKPRTDDEYRDALAACLAAAKRMTTLVDGLLTVARADAGKLDLQRGSIDLRDVVASAAEQLRPLAESKRVTVSLDLSTAAVAGDATRMSQVVTNLISNAIYYNRDGGAIHVRLATDSATVILSVTDTGCGISVADQALLFERFYRADKSRARTSGGHGLGLAICKSIVEAHGGTIDFTTERDQGTTFRVILPRADSVSAATP
jgi:heavy metal sensor kinase